MTIQSQQPYNIAWIFDWNRRYEEVSIFRVTRDLPSLGFDGKPRRDDNGRIVGCIRVGAINPVEEMTMDMDWLKTLPTGRYHFKGYYWSHYDAYNGDHDGGIDLVCCTRLRNYADELK